MPASRPRLYVLLLILVLAVPRLARLLYPQVWIEDEWYLNGAFMLSRGWMPYRDFPLPHLPLLEAALAIVFKIAPITIRTAEIVTAAAALTGSVLVFAIGQRIAGRGAGTAAALIFATSSVLFRYHVFEREVFVVVPVMTAVWLALRPTADSATAEAADHAARPISAGVLLAIAMAIKMTAFAAFAAVVAELLLERRRRDAGILAGTAAALIAAASLVLAALFGTDFLVQVFVFRIVHASFPSLGVKLNEMRYTLDVAFATGVAGAVFIIWTGRAREWRAILLQLGSGFVFLVLLNATYWAHTGIELLPWLALCGGVMTAGAIESLVFRRAHPEPAKSRGRKASARPVQPRGRLDRRVPAGVCVFGAVLFVVYVSPIRNLNWQAGNGSVYGFGYRDRDEVARAAAFVAAHTSADSVVATPPIIAFLAHRREIVPYAELAGDIGELTDAVRREGYVSAIATSPLRSRMFWDGVEAGRQRFFPLIDRAVAEHTVAAVINYSADDLFPLPLVDVAQEKLEAAGYDLASITTHYEIWLAPHP